MLEYIHFFIPAALTNDISNVSNTISERRSLELDTPVVDIDLAVKNTVSDCFFISKDMVSLFHINIQCLSNKVAQLALFLTKFKYDVICLSEHWMNDSSLKIINLGNYYLASSFSRSINTHGGVAIFLKNHIKCISLNVNEFNSEFNSEFCGVELSESKTLIFSLYRSCSGDFKVFLINLENLLFKYSARGLKIVLVGDFNINFHNKTSQLTDLVSLIDSFGLHIVITDYTRITAQSSTCIDNILTDMNESDYTAAVMEPCLSDHLGQYIIIKSTTGDFTKEVKRRRITKNGIAKLRASLSDLDWNIFSNNENSVDFLSNFLVNNYRSLVHQHFPQIKCTPGNSKPPIIWFNESLRKMRDTLSCVKLICNVTKNPDDFKMYKNLHKEYKFAINETKKAAYDQYIEKSENKSRDGWRLVNYERNHKHSSKIDSTLSQDDFNNYFSTVADNILGSLPNSDININDMLKKIPVTTASFFLLPVSMHEVSNAVNSLKNSPCIDVYDLNSKIIKETIDIILHPLTVLINRCFSEGIFPDSFKITKVIPLFKKGDTAIVDNYRPISIIPIFGKLVEILLKWALTQYCERNSIITDCQFGFRPKLSTTQAVQRVVGDIVENLEAGKHTGIALCDLSKAFDCVPHDLLLTKLSYYGIRGLPLSLFESYLSNRKQCAYVNNISSAFNDVKHGVPQGSVLGPLLFILFVNDISHFIHPYKCILFADDTTLITSNTDYSNLVNNLKHVEKSAEKWFIANKLKLNSDKSQTLILSSNHNVIRGENVKLLGVVLDDNLSWSGHVDCLRKSLTSVIFLLRQLRLVLGTTTLLSTYFALFQSRISYAVILWGNSCHALKIFRLQKRAIRVLAGINDNRVHCKMLFKKFGIMPLPSLYIYASLVEIHKNINSFNTNSDHHNYSTRSANLIRTPRFRLKKSECNSLNIKLYNRLPPNMKLLNFNQFKYVIKKIILEHCFYSVDDFMETSFN